MTRIIEAIDHSSNSTMAFNKKITSRIFCKCKWHCWVWRMIDSLYYSSRKISERCENSFVNYRINYQKLCYSLRRIWTQPACCIRLTPATCIGQDFSATFLIWPRVNQISRTLYITLIFSQIRYQIKAKTPMHKANQTKLFLCLLFLKESQFFLVRRDFFERV